MSDKLSRITIKGFKSIRDLDGFELKPLNVLIGENGSGKSNFISFFRFLSWMLASPGNLQTFVNKHGFGSSFLYNGPKTTDETGSEEPYGILAVLNIATDSGTYHYAFRLFPALPDTLLLEDEQFFRMPKGADTPRDWVAERGSHAEAKVIQEAEGGNKTAKFILGFLSRIQVHQFHNTSETARIRLGFPVDDNGSLREDGANLASVLLRLRDDEPSYYKRIVERIREVTPFFADFVFEPSGGRLLLKWREKDSDVVFGPHQASDGTLRVMALFTLLQMPSENLPDVIVLDEPELGLHPSAIHILAGLLRGLSETKQVILATQSMGLVNYFEPEEIVVIERPEGASTFKRLSAPDLSEWLKEYSMGELWEKNVIGGTPK